MLFNPSLRLLAIYCVKAWLVLLFQIVIFFAENSPHHKQSKERRSYGRLFYAPASFVKKNYNALDRSSQPRNMRMFLPLAMITSVQSAALLAASATILGLAIGLAPKPQDDLKGLAACQLLHPDRYCRITYAPSTIAP